MNAHYTRLIDSQISLAMERAEDAERRIQKLIEDFLFYADRHGGY